jgi:type I restriction enzyme S subunit
MIEAHIHQRFPFNDQRCAVYRQELIRTCNEFVDRGLADPKFVVELTSGQDSKFWSCLSEALLADRLSGKSFPVRSERGKGPDFLVMDGNLRVWIEVICPEPTRVPDTWSTYQPGGVINFPHQEILLRWTSAIKEKAEKLIGSVDGKVKGYLKTGIVAPNDAYVIAVNGCQLRNGPFSAHFGISQFPFAAEAVFPIGPYQLKIHRETLEVVERGHQHRPFIQNQNDALVPAYAFLDPRFNPVSAIWAVDLNGGSSIGNSEPMAVIHNPNAVNPVSVGFLPADDEYMATPISSNELTLKKVGADSVSDD